MFWIIGGDAIAVEIGKLFPNSAVGAVVAQFSEHVEWEGFRYYDMIFPLFLFIIGVAIPYAIGRRLEQGDTKREILKKILVRTAILFGIGLIYNGGLHFDGWEHLRIFGVLQRLALGYCAASILFLYTKPKTQAIVSVSILLGYWAILRFVSVPGFPLGTYSPEGNVANYLDRLMLLPGQMYEKYGDPEGLLSTIPAVATALMGLGAGQWLKSNRGEMEKLRGLVLAAAISLAVGLAWSPLLPIIKKIWTSSYVLIAGGFSLLLLALFYWLIDIKGWTKWSFPLAVIGTNALAIYLLSEVVDFDKASRYFLQGVADHSAIVGALIIAVGVIVTKWLVLWLLHRNRLFWRV